MAYLCVFCGSSTPADPKLTEQVKNIAEALADSGWDLAYGGGTHGLMGTVGETFLSQGRKVAGIMPKALAAACPEKAVLKGSEHIEVNTMFERKQLMIRHSDAFLILPGGVGTLDELTEVWSHKFFNGFCPALPFTIPYSVPISMPFLTEGDKLTYKLFQQRVEEGFIRQEVLDLLHVGTGVESIRYLNGHLKRAA